MSEELQSSYDSIAQAAKALGCTVARLRKAKKQGAPGFRGSRVYPGELVPWLKGKEGGEQGAGSGELDKEAWEIRKLRLQCEGLELANKQKGDLLWEATAVKVSWLSHMRSARQVLVQMATDLAPRIAGRPALECEKLLSAAAEETLAKLRGNPYGDGPCACPSCQADLAALLIEAGSREQGAGSKEAEKAKAKGKRK